MLQVASFLLPAEQDTANAFLATHKPSDGGINFNKDTIIVFYEDGSYPPEYAIADLEGLQMSVRNAKFQQEITLHVLKAELADTPTNLARYDELSAAVRVAEAAIANQEIKADFLQKRIEALRPTEDVKRGK